MFRATPRFHSFGVGVLRALAAKRPSWFGRSLEEKLFSKCLQWRGGALLANQWKVGASTPAQVLMHAACQDVAQANDSSEEVQNKKEA